MRHPARKESCPAAFMPSAIQFIDAFSKFIEEQ
jgi:hypothetical protein